MAGRHHQSAGKTNSVLITQLNRTNVGNLPVAAVSQRNFFSVDLL